MNITSAIRALIFVLPLSLFAGPDTSTLVIGNAVRRDSGKVVFMGSVSVVSKNPDEKMEVSANEIIFEQVHRRPDGANLLRCSGAVTVRSAGRTITGQDLTIELGDMRGNVYVLDQNGIVTSGTAAVTTRDSYSWPQRQDSPPLPTFDAVPAKSVETQLRRIPVTSPWRDYAPGVTSPTVDPEVQPAGHALDEAACPTRFAP